MHFVWGASIHITDQLISITAKTKRQSIHSGQHLSRKRLKFQDLLVDQCDVVLEQLGRIGIGALVQWVLWQVLTLWNARVAEGLWRPKMERRQRVDSSREIRRRRKH